jgi:starch synthase
MVIGKIRDITRQAPARRLKVAMCAMESHPFAKTGGLGDVMGSLPYALKKEGVDCRFIMPYYTYLFRKNLAHLDFRLHMDLETVSLNDREEYFDIYTLENRGVRFYFIRNDRFFNRKHIYGRGDKDYCDNNVRFCFFSRAVLTLLRLEHFIPDIIHINDYHCGMLPVFLHDSRRKDDIYKKQFENTHVVYTIHNLSYQGIYNNRTFEYTGLDETYNHYTSIEYYGKVNFMKAGILYSDRITTVSPNYSREILDPAYGFGLEGILKQREKALTGIINGLDPSWDPSLDVNIFRNYSPEDLSGKAGCKKMIMKKIFRTADSERPLLAVVSRLTEQKGIDLLMRAMDRIMRLDVFLMILGSGEEKYIRQLKSLRLKYKKKLNFSKNYNEKFARRIFAGSDIFLMPSKFEPCGLSQIIAMKYGTIPVVRKTGGLANTVMRLNRDASNSGTGFVFNEYDAKDFYSAVKRAVSIYHKKENWQRIMKNSMCSDFSWRRSARKYIDLYRDAAAKDPI